MPQPHVSTQEPCFRLGARPPSGPRPRQGCPVCESFGAGNGSEFLRVEPKRVPEECHSRSATQCDRMGARLDGPALPRLTQPNELLSEAVAPARSRCANDGHRSCSLEIAKPSGGYPKIAHVITVDLPVAAQLRPNDIGPFPASRRSRRRPLFSAARRTTISHASASACIRAPDETPDRSECRSGRRRS